MTQALMNSLNKTDNLQTADNKTSAVADVSDFSQILDMKTFKQENTKNEEISNICKTIGDLKNELSSVTENISTLFNDAIAEAGAEYALDLTLVQDETPEEISETDNKDIQNETITNKEPQEMQKLNLTQIPENPVNLYLITSQQNQLKSDIQDLSQSSDDYSSQDVVLKLADNTQESIFEQSADLNTDINKNVQDVENEKHTIDEKLVKELNIEEIETSTSGNETASDDLMQNQSPQEHGIKAMLNSDIKYDDIVSSKSDKTMQQSTELAHSKIIEQVTKQLDGMKNFSKVNIVLNPESLGRVMLQIVNSKNGVSAQFTVTTQDAKNLLMQGLDNLKDNLLSHGVSVDNVNIKLNEVEESKYNPDWTEQENSKGNPKEQNQKQQKKDKKQFEQMMFELNNNDKV